jgi:hypothetical protein
MPIAPWSWPRRRRPARAEPRPLTLEWLEDRTLLSSSTLRTATPLTFSAFRTAQAAQFLADPREADLYEVTLNAGDRISAGVIAQAAGSGLQSLLRIFDSHGTPLVLDNQEGGDPSLTFQAAATGAYFIGVSSAPNNDYNPTLLDSGSTGGTTGLYTLNVRLTPGATLQPDMAGSSFRLQKATAATGDSVPVSFAVENRGTADPGNFQVQVLLASNNLFDASAQVVQTFTRSQLTAAGNSFSSPAGFAVTLPAGLASGPLFVGLRIIPDPGVPDAGSSDKSGVHRGEDWDTLTVVTSVLAGGTDLSAADSHLNTRAGGTLMTSGQVDTYSFTVAQGSGSLSATVTPAGGAFVPRLTLSGPGGTLIQSDSGTLAQVLLAGSYSLAVSSQSGSGSYQLTTTFVPAGPALQSPAVGSYPNTAVVAADLNGDGKPDLVTTNAGNDTVSVLLGNGDGTFRPQQSRGVGPGPVAVAVADLNGDGKPDLVVVNSAQTVAFGGTVTGGTFTLLFDGEQTTPLAFNASASDVQKALHNLSVLKDAGPGSVVVTGTTGNYEVAIFLPGVQVPLLSYTNSLTGIAPTISVAAVGEVSVLLGKGDGTFGTAQTFDVGMDPTSVAVADLNGDGIPDLVVTNQGGNTISVLLGNGAGTFATAQTLTVGTAPTAVAAADLDGDGKPDLVVANSGDGTVSVLRNTTTRGAATFSFVLAQQPNVGPDPIAVAVADINNDGKLDLVVTNHAGASDAGSGTVTVLLGNGDGTFQKNPQIIMVGSGPTAAPFNAGPAGVAVADLNNDGNLDIVAATQGDYTVTVLLNATASGASTVSFTAQPIFALDALIDSVTVADVNGDGKPDFVGAYSRYYGRVPVLLGDGDGSFQVRPMFRVGSNPDSVAVADLNGDGKPDAVAADKDDNTVSVLLGNGDGSFQRRQIFQVGANPVSVAVADVNNDGIPDLVVANAGDNTVSVLLGNGDGTFQPQQTYPVAEKPTSVAVADLAGDGIADVIVTELGPGGSAGTVDVLVGNGDGTFGMTQAFPVGLNPSFVAVAGGKNEPDLNGDGKPDLVVANKGDGTNPSTVSVLLNTTSAGATVPTFAAQQTYGVGVAPVSVAVGDLNGDGRPDLVVANQGGNSVSVLENTAGGTFQPQPLIPVGSKPTSVAVLDLDGDGRPDIAIANKADYSVSMLRNTTPAKGATPSFDTNQTIGPGKLPYSLGVADINGDGIPDLVVANKYGDNVGVLLGTGHGTVTVSTATNAVGLSSTPYLEDLDGDGIPDLVVLDSGGDILFRKGLGNNQFQAPVILNPGHPARDLTVFRTAAGWAIATADALPLANTLTYTVSVYTLDTHDHVTPAPLFTTTSLPTRIVAGDLTGDGLDDLVVAEALGDTVQVAMHNDIGHLRTLDTGSSPSDVALVDVNGDNLRDVVVTNQASGDVSVFLNDLAHSFATGSLLRGGPGPGDLAAATSGVIQSDAVAVSLAAGNFTGGGGLPDLVVVNRGAHSFTVLANNGQGGLANPQAALTTSTSDGLAVNEQPGPVVVGDFNRDGNLDLAILMEDTGQVWIFTGNGHGTFTHAASIPVGPWATGLNVVPGSAPGLFDLLVGDQFGDVLTLVGQGDGTFRLAAGDRVSLDVQPGLLGPGQPGVLVANQQTDEVTVQAPAGRTQFASVQSLASADPLAQVAPGDVHWAVLDKNSTLPDAVVVGSGSNDVVIYRTVAVVGGVPVFAPDPQTYFVGTDPVNVTIQNINGNGIPDLLVANRGSNDVSILFGSYDSNGDWVGTPGPRLNSGGFGPVAVNVVPDHSSPGGSDLAVTNGTSGTLTLLPGRGQGFFDDRNPQVLDVPGNPVLGQGPVFLGASGAGVLLTGAGQLVGFNLDNFAATVATVFTPPAGEPVLAVQALADGNLVVAEQGGTVAILAEGPGSLFEPVEILTPLTGIPTNPSALAVLGDEVLVTNAGEDQVFVYEPPATFVPGESGSLPPQVPGAPVSETATPGAAPLAAVTTLTVSLIPPLTTTATEVFESAVLAAELGIEVVANAGEDTAGTISNIPIQGATDDTDEQPDATAPESNFGLGIEEKLRQLELQKKGDGKPDGPSSRRAPGDGLSDEALAVFWPEGDVDWLPDLPVAPGPEGDEAAILLAATPRPVGGKELPPLADDADAVGWPSVPDEVVEAVRQTVGLSRPDQEQPARDANPVPVEVRLPLPQEGGEPGALFLAVAGLACWVEKREKARTDPARPS